MLIGAIVDDKPIPFDKLEEQYPYMFPPELINAIVGEERINEIHVSDLTICPYAAAKQKLVDYYLPAENIYRMIRGKAWDCLSQKYARGKDTYYQIRLGIYIGDEFVIVTVANFRKCKRKLFTGNAEF